MPRVLKKTLCCPSCGKTLAAKSVRRHMRDLMGLCTREQRRAARQAATLRRLLARQPRRTEQTRSLNRRRRQDSSRASSPFPFPPTRPVRRPSQGDLPTSHNSCLQPPSPHDAPLSQSPPPGRTDFELYMRGRAWHDDFASDTPGAGPSHERDPYAELRNLAADDEQEMTERLPTLADQAEWIHGLSAQETLEQELEAELSRGGGRQLDPADLATVRAFNYKVDTDISAGAFNKLPRAFPELSGLQSLHRTRTRIARLSGVQGVEIDCCINSCVAFTGTIKSMEQCPYCLEARYMTNPEGRDQRRPRCQFRYIPIIPRLRNLFLNPEMIHELSYRTRRRSEAGVLADIFDGTHYRNLLNKCVSIAGEELGHKFFSNPSDIALGLSTDGFAPFDSNNVSCWPIILFNYNLSPAIRFQLENIMCVGIVPGPSQPKDINTFVEALIEELEDLARGVPAFHSVEKRAFRLHAYLLVCFGDMPAVSKLMCMTGHNGKVPCRACMIRGTRIIKRGRADPTQRKNYHPLRRPFARSGEPRVYNPLDLPLRTHDQFVLQASMVQDARNDTEEARLATQYGIQAIPPLARLASIELPGSFPHDFMHAVFENVIPTLISLWTRDGRFKAFGSGHEGYILRGTIWEDIGAACHQSGDTIPAAFGCRVPDFSDTKKRVTAESRMLFTTLLAPALLHGRFTRPVYYQHFMTLVHLISTCLQLRMTTEDVDSVRKGFAKWVEDYEKLYYEHKAERVRACSLPIHSLLHIADDIQFMGPVWCYWAFPMERFCGALCRTNISTRHPWKSLNETITQVAQLTQLKHMYGLSDELNLEARHSNIATGTRYDSYDDLVFVFPRRRSPIPRGSIRRRVANYLGLVLNEDSNFILEHLNDRQFILWGKMQEATASGPGDTFRGHTLCKDSTQSRRDASYVQYLTYYDRWNRRSVREVDEQTTGYGRVEFFVVIDTEFLQELFAGENSPSPYLRPHVLAIISPIPRFSKVSEGAFVRFELNANGTLASPEIIDANDVLHLIGRVCDRDGRWSIVDRETVVGRLDMMESVVDRR